MVINDQLGFFSESPLRGKNDDEFGLRFPDMSEIYNKTLIEKLKPIIKKHDSFVGQYFFGLGEDRRRGLRSS